MTPTMFTFDVLRNYLLVGAALLALGMLGFLARRNLIVMFLSAEMMLQGTALTLVGFGRYHGNWTGQVFTIVILTVAACEASIALALILILLQPAVVARRDALAGHPRAGPCRPTPRSTWPSEAEPVEAIAGPESYPHLTPPASSRPTPSNPGPSGEIEPVEAM